MYMKNIMFNQDQKKEYIKFDSSNCDALKRYFVRLAAKEAYYKKDIADMDVDELKDTILSMGIRRQDSRGHLISLLRGYINWAILNQKTQRINNAIDKITPENTNSQEIIRQTMIKSPEHLQEILDNTLDYVNYENRSIRDSLIFWLLYYGVDLKDLGALKKENINKVSKIVTTATGKQYEIDDNTLELWIKCCEITYIERKNSIGENLKNKKAVEYTKSLLVDNDYLFRPICGSNGDPTRKCSINTFRNLISKIFIDKDRNIPARNINYSSKFYQIYLLEQKNGTVPLNVFAEKFEINNTNDIDLLKDTRKWRIDYENWKLAFWIK